MSLVEFLQTVGVTNCRCGIRLLRFSTSIRHAKWSQERRIQALQKFTVLYTTVLYRLLPTTLPEQLNISECTCIEIRRIIINISKLKEIWRVGCTVEVGGRRSSLVDRRVVTLSVRIRVFLTRYRRDIHRWPATILRVRCVCIRERLGGNELQLDYTLPYINYISRM